MTRILKYFFYKIYSFSLSNGEKDAGWAMTIVALFVLANVYSIFDIILILTKTQLPKVGNVVIIAACGLILYAVYAMLMKNGKAEIIAKEFQAEQTNKSGLNLALILYIILTISIFIYTGNVVRSLNA